MPREMPRTSLILLLLAPAASLATWNVQVDFTTVIRVSSTVTTLQVVSNPILDRTFTAPNGTVFKNPIHDNAWASLVALQADLVRYVPWYPYPKKGVAELDAPMEGKATSWNFTYILPMLEDLMQAVYAKNHTVVLNFATQPCWLFGDAKNRTQNCSYPANADESDFHYKRGDRKNLLDPSAKTMAAYFGRLLAYLVKGEFVDEHGMKHSGGPAYSNFNRAHGHVWELFNEGEHRYNADEYIHDYDVIIPEMIKAVGGPASAPAFMATGGWSRTDWVADVVNVSKHSANPPPVDYVSTHFYAGCKNRTDPGTYFQFFEGAHKYVGQVQKNLAACKASSFPDVKLDLNELGVIMPDDNNPAWGIDGNLPDIYWNAAGAMYSYLFATLAPMGVDVLGHSQLAGSPKIPEWGIPLPQYPSVSLLDWRTGYGNARYWALKLLIEEFAPGDKLVKTSCSDAGEDSNDAPRFSCLGAVKPDMSKKLLLVNHLNEVQEVKLSGLPAAEFSLKIVDPKSVQRGSADGIRHAKARVSQSISLEPWAVVVVSIESSETASVVTV